MGNKKITAFKNINKILESSNTCDSCGVCCEIFLINLNEEEYRSHKFKTQLEEFGFINDFQEAESCGANIIEQKEDGSCIYLENKKCSIHLSRPAVCRKFFCVSEVEEFQGMILDISERKYENNRI